MDLPRGIPDRIMYGTAGLFLVFLFIPFLACVYYWAPTELTMQVAKYVAEEVLFLFVSGFVFAFIWCLCTPKWVENMLAKRTTKFAVVSGILFVGLIITLLAAAIMHPGGPPTP